MIENDSTDSVLTVHSQQETVGTDERDQSNKCSI